MFTCFFYLIVELLVLCIIVYVDLLVAAICSLLHFYYVSRVESKSVMAADLPLKKLNTRELTITHTIFGLQRLLIM